MVEERRRPRCPVCHKTVLDAPNTTPGAVAPVPACRPFCSDRCKMVDLSRWLGGEYAIAGTEVAVVDDDES